MQSTVWAATSLSLGASHTVALLLVTLVDVQATPHFKHTPSVVGVRRSLLAAPVGAGLLAHDVLFPKLHI